MYDFSIAGQKGGLSTLSKHGIEHYREIGKKGGRPHRRPLSEIQAEKQRENKEI